MRIRICFCIGILAALAGCGQKGALYLPDEDRTAVPKADADAKPAVSTPTDGANPTDASTEERKRKN